MNINNYYKEYTYLSLPIRYQKLFVFPTVLLILLLMRYTKMRYNLEEYIIHRSGEQSDAGECYFLS